MTRFTLKGAAAIIEDHQKSIRQLETENDALKAELAKARGPLLAAAKYHKEERIALRAHIAELERGLRHWPDELREDCEDCQIIIRVKKEAPRP
jgi:hypothetical protein